MYKKGLVDPFLMIGEEGAEVAKEVFKAQRFGLMGDPEWTSQPGNKPPRDNIVQEIGDFLYVLDAMLASGAVTHQELYRAKFRKEEKMLALYGGEALGKWKQGEF